MFLSSRIYDFEINDSEDSLCFLRRRITNGLKGGGFVPYSMQCRPLGDQPIQKCVISMRMLRSSSNISNEFWWPKLNESPLESHIPLGKLVETRSLVCAKANQMETEEE